MDRSKRYNDNEIRRMTHDAISSGAGLDQTDFRGGNTLLHEAIQNDLEDCVIKLLSAGADPNVKNAKGETPFDIALDGGNQLLMHLLSRREEYRRQVYHGHDPSSSSSWQNFAMNGVNTVSLQVIYEDYWDWSDTTKIHHLYKLIDEAKGDELKYQQKLQDLIARKSKSGANLQKLQELLKKKEIRQRTRRWDIKDVVKRNLHAVDIISDDLERLKKLLEKVHSTVYWRGVVEIRRYKGFIFQRWREASLIVTGSMLIVDYSRDHEEHRVSPEDGEDTLAVSTSPYGSSTSMSMSHHHHNHQYSQHHSHSHRTQSMSHHSSTSMSWSDGPLRRQFRHLSSSVSSSSTPATTLSSSSSLSSSGRRIYHIPIRNLRRLHIHKIPGQHGLDYEIKLSYSNESSPAGTTASGVSMAAHFSSAQHSSTVTTRSPSTFLSASYSAAWTSFTTGGDDALTSAAAAASAGGDGRTRSRSGERESFCSPDTSSEKLKTLHLRKVSSSGSSSSGGNSSQMDHLPHTLKSLHADVAILVTMEGSTGNFSEPALDDYDMDELYAADPDEDNSNLNEKTRLLLLAAGESSSSSAAGDASATGSTKRSRRATLDTIHYPADTTTTALGGSVTARDSFFADDDGVSEIDGSGILTRSPVDRNSSLTGHSSNLSNLFRAVAASDRSSIGSSLSHASSGATSMESLATLTSAMQTRRVSSQLSGIEEEDDNTNRSRVSSSSSVHSALGSPRADTTAALSTATVKSPQGLHQALHMAVTDDGGSFRETVGSKTSVDAADTTMAHDFWRVPSTTTMTAAAPVPATESVTSRGAGSAASSTMAVSLDTAFATGAGGSSCSSSSFLHSQPWRRDGGSATSAATTSTTVAATGSSSVERGSSHPPSMLVPPLAQSSPERTGTLRFPGPLPTSLSALSPPSTSRTPFDTARTTHSATTASSCQSAGGGCGSGRGGGSLLRALPDTASSQGQLSNHSLSSLPSPYRLRGKAIRLRAIPDRTIALDAHRQYRSPRLHDSMVQQIDYVRMLRWLQEQTKTVRDEMKEQLHYAILHREELKQEYEYLFLLRQLAGNPPQAPTSVFRIRRTVASGTTATATSAAAPSTTTTMRGDAASGGGVGGDGAALAATFEEAVTLLTKYTDHVDEQARLQDWLPSGGGDTGAMRSPPRRSMHTIQSTYPSQQSQQSLAAAVSAAHANANANARTPIATTMATSSSSFSEARELLQYLTRSEHHLSDLLPAATAAAAVGAVATAQRPKDCGSGSRVSPWRGALSQQQRRSLLHANGGGAGDEDELQSLRMRLVYDDDGGGTGAGGSSESQLRDTTVSLSVADDDFVSTRGSYSYAAAYTTRVASSAIDRPSDLSNRPSLSSLRAAAEMSIAGTGHHYDDGDDDGDRDEAIATAAAAAAAMGPSASDIDGGNGSGGGGGIVSWRNKLGPPPPAYRKYFEKLLSNVEQIWNCELESYETFKKLASSIVLREETLHRITALRAKQRDVVTSSHRNTVVAPPQDELYEVEI